MSVTVAELAAVLSLKTDKASFEKGDHLIEKIKEGALRMFEFETIKRAGEWLSEAVEGVTHTAVSVSRLSQSTGVSTKALQELGYAADVTSGVSMQSLGAALGRVSRAAAAGAKGGKLQAKAFKDIGVSAKDVAKGIVPLQTVLMKTADKIASMPKGVEKNNLAMALFGRSGRDLIPMLNKGSEGIRELSQEAEDLGIVLSKESIESFEQFEESGKRMGGMWTGFKNVLATALLPALKDILGGFVKWFKANKELVKQRIQDFAKLVSAALKGVAAAVVIVLDVMKFFAEHWDIAKWAVYGIIAALVAYKVATMAAGIASAISWAIALWPLALLLVAIGLVALAVEDLYTYFEGGDSVFGELVDAVQKYIGVDVVNTIATAVSIIIALFTNWWDTMKMIFSFVSLAFKGIEFAVNAVWKIIKPILDAIGAGLDAVDNILGAGGSGEGIDATLQHVWGDLDEVRRRNVPDITGGAARAATAVLPGSSPSRPDAVSGGSSRVLHQSVQITVNDVTGDGDGLGRKIAHHVGLALDDQNRKLAIGTGGI